MKKWTFVFFTLCIVCGSNSAYSQSPGTKRFAVSHIIYEGLEQYVQLIDEIYTELGFSVSMVPTPAARGLVLLNDGVVDADLVRIKNAEQDYPNVMLVSPSLNNVKLVLLCVKGVPCHKSVIMDPDANILLNKAAVKQFGEGEFLAQEVRVPSVSSAQGMLKAQRVFYAIYVVDGVMEKQISKEFNLVTLRDLSVYHLINKKHIDLLPQIEAKLREKLPSFQANLNTLIQ